MAHGEQWIFKAVDEIRRKYLAGYQLYLPDSTDGAYVTLMAYKPPPPPPPPPAKDTDKKDKEGKDKDSKDKDKDKDKDKEKDKEKDGKEKEERVASGGTNDDDKDDTGGEEVQFPQLKEIVVLRVTNVVYIFDVVEYGRRCVTLS
jgi:outer membrane biosynthesis protein TonB